MCLPLLDCVSCVPPASLAMRAAVRERYGIEVTLTCKNTSKYMLRCLPEICIAGAYTLISWPD